MTPEVAWLEYYVLKCYWVTIYVSSELDAYDELAFGRWMGYIVALTARNLDVVLV